MSINLVELAKGLFTQDVVSGAGATLGEDEGNIRKAINAIIPSVLLGLFQKADNPSDPVRGQVISTAAELAGNPDPAGNLQSILGGNAANADHPWIRKGQDLLRTLFGDKTDAITNMVSGYSGIKASSANTLMSAAAPAVLGIAGSQAHGNGEGIWALLLAQKDAIIRSLPSGLNLTGIPLLGNFAGWFSPASPPATPASPVSETTYPDRKKGSGGWLLWLLLLVLVALAIWYFMGQKGCNSQVKVPAEDTAMMAPMNPDTNAGTAAATPARESIKVQLPDGSELDAYRGGIEDMLVTFLKSDYKKLAPDSLKNIWFDFDNLNFETGSAKITPESQMQINNLTAILKAFPGARLKIGGYTDKTGNEPGNVKLSGERAKAVKTALTDAGVGNQVEGAEGYGSKFAKFPAEAPETDRIKDRHVSVSVRG